MQCHRRSLHRGTRPSPAMALSAARWGSSHSETGSLLYWFPRHADSNRRESLARRERQTSSLHALQSMVSRGETHASASRQPEAERTESPEILHRLMHELLLLANRRSYLP